MEIEMKTKSQNGNQTSEVSDEGHQTDLETSWWSADCDVKVKNRKIKVSGMFGIFFMVFVFYFFSENNEG